MNQAHRNEELFDRTWAACRGLTGICECLNVGNDAPFRNVLADADRFLSPWAAETLAKEIRFAAKCRAMAQIFSQGGGA